MHACLIQFACLIEVAMQTGFTLLIKFADLQQVSRSIGRSPGS